MPDQLVSLTQRFGRGLNLADAPDALEDGQARILQNWRIPGRGWITSRKAAVELSTPDGAVILIVPFNHTGSVGAALVVFDDANSRLELWTVDGAGGSATNVGTIPGYTSGVSSAPEMVGAVLGKVLFLCDVAKARGLVCYDPNDVLGSGSAMFQPTFDFDGDASDWDEAFPAFVVEHQNHLWMFGYGDEEDPNRGEVGRFSFLGLLDDGQGAGDAGVGGATGSEDLFDQEDAVPVAPRGENVVAAASANGRLVVTTERRASVIYGSGRTTWRLDPLDNQRGCVAPRAMIEADGVVYWLSPLGPARYRGGGLVDDLSELVDVRMEEIDLASVFTAHQPAENQVRWYYRRKEDTAAGADRFLGFDYLNQAFLEDTLPYRVLSAGSLLPSGAEGPAADPSSLTHTDISRTSARATWVNGDSSPGTRTLIWRKKGAGGTYVLLDTLDSGAGEYVHTGLEAGEEYYTKVQHVLNSQTSNEVEASFTTLAAAAVAAPTNVTAEDSAIFGDNELWAPSVLLRWNYAAVPGGLRFIIERNTGSGYDIVHETDFGQTSWRDNGVQEGVSTTYRITAEDRDGNQSSASATANVTPTVESYTGWPGDII